MLVACRLAGLSALEGTMRARRRMRNPARAARHAGGRARQAVVAAIGGLKK